MADAIKNDAPIVDKEAEQEEIKKVVDVVDKTENGVATEAVKETNGEAAPEVTKSVVDEASAEEETEKSGEAVAADPSDDTDVVVDSSNGEKLENQEEVDETPKNGDSTDSSTPAEAVKRKVVVDDNKSEESAATPEKKAKLDESKEEVTNGSEANEVAA